MSNLMKLLGTILALLGLVLGGMSIANPGHMQVYGVQLETAVLMLVGGILAVGLGGVIDSFRSSVPRKQAETVREVMARSAATSMKPLSGSAPVTPEKPVEISPAAEVAATAVATVAGISSDEAEVAVKGASNQVAETINALEQAKKDIIKSMGGMEETTGGASDDEEADKVEDEEELDPPGPEDDLDEPVVEHSLRGGVDEPESGAEGLYVVEEKVIRGRPARILSDDTIEAETDEGWMRFEDFDHLNEYLDSMEEQAS